LVNSGGVFSEFNPTWQYLNNVEVDVENVIIKTKDDSSIFFNLSTMSVFSKLGRFHQGIEKPSFENGNRIFWLYFV